MKTGEPLIIIFDGVCNACNGWVNFVQARDRHKRFKYAPFQSETGKKYLEQFHLPTENVSTIYFVQADKCHARSNAALHILKEVGFPWSLFIAFKIVPRFIRDWVYDWIARNRYKWFGKSQSCRMPEGW